MYKINTNIYFIHNENYNIYIYFIDLLFIIYLLFFFFNYIYKINNKKNIYNK